MCAGSDPQWRVSGSPQQPQQSYQSTRRQSNTFRNNVAFRFRQ